MEDRVIGGSNRHAHIVFKYDVIAYDGAGCGEGNSNPVATQGIPCNKIIATAPHVDAIVKTFYRKIFDRDTFLFPNENAIVGAGAADYMSIPVKGNAMPGNDDANSIAGTNILGQNNRISYLLTTLTLNKVATVTLTGNSQKNYHGHYYINFRAFAYHDIAPFCMLKILCAILCTTQAYDGIRGI